MNQNGHNSGFWKLDVYVKEERAGNRSGCQPFDDIGRFVAF